MRRLPTQEVDQTVRHAGPPRRVLVVCTANQCRSPMAEGLIRARLRPDSNLEVRSAGTWAEAEIPPTDYAVDAMAERGIDIGDIRSEEVTRELVEVADLVLVMTDSHKEALEAEFEAARGKTVKMSALAGGSWDVADPIGGTPDEYRATADELDRLIASGWDRILGARPPNRA